MARINQDVSHAASMLTPELRKMIAALDGSHDSCTAERQLEAAFKHFAKAILDQAESFAAKAG